MLNLSVAEVEKEKINLKFSECSLVISFKLHTKFQTFSLSAFNTTTKTSLWLYLKAFSNMSLADYKSQAHEIFKRTKFWRSALQLVRAWGGRHTHNLNSIPINYKRTQTNLHSPTADRRKFSARNFFSIICLGVFSSMMFEICWKFHDIASDNAVNKSKLNFSFECLSHASSNQQFWRIITSWKTFRDC